MILTWGASELRQRGRAAGGIKADFQGLFQQQSATSSPASVMQLHTHTHTRTRFDVFFRCKETLLALASHFCWWGFLRASDWHSEDIERHPERHQRGERCREIKPSDFIPGLCDAWLLFKCTRRIHNVGPYWFKYLPQHLLILDKLVFDRITMLTFSASLAAETKMYF